MQNSEKDYTKGNKLISESELNLTGNIMLKINIYKSKTRNPDKRRFLVWFNDYNICALVWKDGMYKSINDVGKTSDGKNWYSYADCKLNKMLSEYTNSMDNKALFKELAIKLQTTYELNVIK